MRKNEEGTASLVIIFSLLALSACLIAVQRTVQLERMARIHEQQAVTSAAAWGAARVAARQGGSFEGKLGPLAWKGAPAGAGRTVGTATLVRAVGRNKKLHSQALIVQPQATGAVSHGQ